MTIPAADLDQVHHLIDIVSDERSGTGTSRFGDVGESND